MDLATYEVIGDPPSFMGAVNVNCAVLVPVATTFVMVGVLGIVGAMVGLDEIEAGDEPLLLMATTVNE